MNVHFLAFVLNKNHRKVLIQTQLEIEVEACLTAKGTILQALFPRRIITWSRATLFLRQPQQKTYFEGFTQVLLHPLTQTWCLPNTTTIEQQKEARWLFAFLATVQMFSHSNISFKFNFRSLSWLLVGLCRCLYDGGCSSSTIYNGGFRTLYVISRAVFCYKC